MHALKYCCFFDNSIWFGKCQKNMKKQNMKPENVSLGFFTNHLKLVNLIPEHQFSEAATLAVAQSWLLGSQIADKKKYSESCLFRHIHTYSGILNNDSSDNINSFLLTCFNLTYFSRHVFCLQ